MKPNVLKAIRSEREHQDARFPGHHHSVGEWILILEKLLGDAKRAWISDRGDVEALHEIRQLTATGVAAMEQCGAPLRVKSRSKFITRAAIVALGCLLLPGCAPFKTWYQAQGWTPSSVNYTYQRDRITGAESDYFGASWDLK
jgi:hypothetical protein